MKYQSILFEVDRGVARITLNRPDAANAMDRAFMHEIEAVAMACDSDTSVRAVLLTGTGKFFSAGGDLAWFGRNLEEVGDLIKEATLHLHGAISCFSRMGKPMVVAINGAAAGAGFSLALLGDYRIAVDSASFTMAYTGAGLSPDGGSTYLLPRLIGEGRARELMVTNRKLTAAEALEWGMINALVPQEELMPAAEKMARRLADGPTRAYGTVNELLNQSSHNSLETQLEFEAKGIVENAMAADGQEGIAAFLAKRRPEFKGS